MSVLCEENLSFETGEMKYDKVIDEFYSLTSC